MPRKQGQHAGPPPANPWASPTGPPQPGTHAAVPPQQAYSPFGTPPNLGAPPYQPPQQGPLRPIRGLSIAVLAMFVVWAATELGAGVVSGLRYLMIGQYLADESSVPITDLEANDNAYAVTGILQMVGTIALAVVFIVWLFRARANAEALVPYEHRRQRVWLVLGWIVPIISFWFPQQIVNDIAVASDPAHPNRNPKAGGPFPGIVLAWWILYLIYSYGGNVVTRLLFRSETLPEIQNAALAELILLPIGMVAAVLAILVVRRITALQESQRVR